MSSQPPREASDAPAVLVRAVSPRLAEAELTFQARESIDADRAVAQHCGYLDLMRRLGHRVVPVPDAPEHPDGAFVEDGAVVVDDVTVLTRREPRGLTGGGTRYQAGGTGTRSPAARASTATQVRNGRHPWASSR